MSDFVMTSPFTGGPVELVYEIRSYEMRGQSFEVKAPLYRCIETGEKFSTDEQDQQFLDDLNCQWRKRNNVPTPDQLKARRLTIKLSGNEMSKLLGFGINQYRQYEKGELPSESNTRLIKLALTDKGLRSLLDVAKESLDKRTIDKLREYLVPGLKSQPIQKVQPFISFKLIEQSMYSGGCAEAEAFTIDSIASATEELSFT